MVSADLTGSNDGDSRLTEVGLKKGDRVRFRPHGKSHWCEGIVTCREQDGSIGLTDERRRTRAIRIDELDVAVTGPRGGRRWEPLTERMARSEQLPLL